VRYSIAEGDANQKQDAGDGDQNGEGCGACVCDEEGERHLRDAKPIKARKDHSGWKL